MYHAASATAVAAHRAAPIAPSPRRASAVPSGPVRRSRAVAAASAPADYSAFEFQLDARPSKRFSLRDRGR